MRKIFAYTAVVLFGLTVFFPKIAFAQFDYCLLSEKRYDIHIFGASYNLDEDRSKLAAGLDQLYKGFEIGDDIRWIVHSINGTKTFQKCVPGCPDKGMLENLLDSSCSEQIAKRDKVQFNNTYAKSFKTAISQAGQPYDVILDIKSISEFYQGRDIEEVEAYAFHTTIPYGSTSQDANSFDAPFVRAIQGNELSTLEIPNIQFVNANRSEHVEAFWKDLKLGGHKSGVDVEFNHLVLD